MPSTKMSTSRPANKKDASFAIAIMAAGKGTRLKSKHPKVLHEVGGRPLLAHVIAAARQVVPVADVYAIIGHEADLVRKKVADTGVNFVVQEPQRGTGHALMCARDALKNYDHVLVLSGDARLRAHVPGRAADLSRHYRQHPRIPSGQERRYDHSQCATR